MPDTIEQLEEKKRRLELEAAIASLERKKETIRVISKTPAILSKVLYLLAVILAAIGSTMFLLGIAYELDGLRAPPETCLSAPCCVPRWPPCSFGAGRDAKGYSSQVIFSWGEHDMALFGVLVLVHGIVLLPFLL